MTQTYYFRGFSILAALCSLLVFMTASCGVERGNEIKPATPENGLTTQGNLGEIGRRAIPQNREFAYSGEDIFRGVFFTEGEVADKIPTLTSQMPRVRDYVIRQSQLDSVLHLQNAVVEGIKRDHAQYLDSLQSAVYEQQPDAIRELIIRGALYTGKFINELPEFKEKEEQIRSISELLQSQNFNDFLKSDGTFDREKFEDFARRNSILSDDPAVRHACLVIPVVILVAYAVVVAAAIAIVGYIAIYGAAAYGFFLANQLVAWNNRTSSSDKPEAVTLQEEMIIGELVRNVGSR